MQEFASLKILQSLFSQHIPMTRSKYVRNISLSRLSVSVLPFRSHRAQTSNIVSIICFKKCKNDYLISRMKYFHRVVVSVFERDFLFYPFQLLSVDSNIIPLTLSNTCSHYKQSKTGSPTKHLLQPAQRDFMEPTVRTCVASVWQVRHVTSSPESVWWAVILAGPDSYVTQVFLFYYERVFTIIITDHYNMPEKNVETLLNPTAKIITYLVNISFSVRSE